MLAGTGLACFRGDRLLFKDLSLQVDAGRALQIRGPNGCGKTTLLRILCGLTRAEEGVIHWRGRPLPAHDPDYLRELRYIGHNDGVKLTLTPRENLRMAMALESGADEAQVEAALARLGLEDFMDVACLTVWEDQSLDYMESEFIYGIGKDLGLSPDNIASALDDVARFFTDYVNQIPHLKEHNLAMQFYDSMSKIVNKLILRNSKRLHKELSESKELVYLLSKSTVKELSVAEKKKVQDQLIDIFKSIPSLAIFMLPGGAVLLPIFIKLIPKLLPSAFDEKSG